MDMPQIADMHAGLASEVMQRLLTSHNVCIKDDPAGMVRRICQAALCERQDGSLEESAQISVLLAAWYRTDVWPLEAGLYAKRIEATQAGFQTSAYGECLSLVRQA